MIRFLCLIIFLAAFPGFNINGQGSFKDSLIRSNPVPSGSNYSFEEKIKDAEQAFEEAARMFGQSLI